tara:strand:- start:3869 stop:4042 length:174 start_codon:yes stop_codon:yes gene_type:complete
MKNNSKKDLIPTLFISNIIKKQDDEEFDNKYISKAINYINNNVTIETIKKNDFFLIL